MGCTKKAGINSAKQIERRAAKAKHREAAIKKRSKYGAKIDKKDLVYQIQMVIRHFFPELFNWMRMVEECRQKASEYELAAHLTACLAVFLFKSGSRNQYNQNSEDARFKKNYKRLFGFKMPHGDSVMNVIKQLKPEQIEKLNHKMIQALINKKIFHTSRFRGKYFRIAVDGSGIGSYSHERDEQCLHKTSKGGKTTWFHSVLDARLVTPQGFSVSIATEWIENPEGGEYVKQDCERKAFIRLAAKLKAQYPRLPMIILADGLYPYQGFFDICKANQWVYCVTFKEGNLQSVWSEVEKLLPLQKNNMLSDNFYSVSNTLVKMQYRWLINLKYYDHTFHWLECVETTEVPSCVPKAEPKMTRFVHITNLPINARNIVNTSRTGRMRWKIENEGFNTLKNGGYGMSHQYARKSYTALKNYFQFMQMAHLIHQLMTLNTRFQEDFMRAKNHPTLKNLWLDLVSAMKWVDLDEQPVNNRINTRQQFRFST